MTVVVFCGPTLEPSEVTMRLAGAEVRGPASRGDVYRAARGGAAIIGIIDGYFRRAPSVWHKEILWALSRGVRVLGAASMGAIRAAEMAEFGMEGVGAIYANFVAGLVDDDEVTIVHGPSEFGFRPLSTALADIRATLREACDRGVVDGETMNGLVRLAKSTHYEDRSYPNLLTDSRKAGVDPEMLIRLSSWLDGNRVEQKRADALMLLDRIAEIQRLPAAALSPPPVFEETTPFALLRVEEHRASSVSSSGSRAASLLDELRLDPSRFAPLEARAYMRCAEISLAEHLGVVVDQKMTDDASDAIRLRLGLLEPVDLQRWMRCNELTFEEYAALVHREALARWSDGARSISTSTALLDELRLENLYFKLAARCDEKERVLHANGVDAAGNCIGGPSEAEALAWLVAERSVDGQLAGPAFPPDFGFGEPEELSRAARREYHFAHAGVAIPVRRLLFAQSVWIADLGVDHLTRELRDLALELEISTPGRQMSNAGGWQSGILRRGHATIDRVLERMMNCVASTLEQCDVAASVRTRAHVEGGWLNVNRFKDHNGPHHHAPSILAGVYYLDATPQQGMLHFLRTSAPTGQRVEYGALSDAPASVEPLSGRLVLFPGLLWHHVAANMTEQPRISFAFNVDLTDESRS